MSTGSLISPLRALSGAGERELVGYRPGVGIMLLNCNGLAFVGHRIRMPAGLARWQMPQGGIDAGESPRQAALREISEEIGTNRVDILAESHGWFHHDVPDEIAQGIMGGQYSGNRQKWLAMRFTGSDADVNLATEHPEFDAWKWVKPERLPKLVAPFMRRLYLDILAEFPGVLVRARRLVGTRKVIKVIAEQARGERDTPASDAPPGGRHRRKGRM